MQRMLTLLRTQILRIPRRARRGSLLIETALVLLIFIPVLALGIEIGARYVRNHQGLNEARLLTQVVDAGATLALRNLDNRINSEIGVGNAQVLTLADLEAEGLWSAGGEQLTALRRKITLILHARGSEELVLLARATALPGEDNTAYIPAGGEGVGLVGFVPPDDTTRLRGPGIDYDLSGIQSLTDAPVKWDAVALRILRMDRDVLPFLHRTVQPNFPELNRMETDLDMNGFNLTGAGILEADQITVTSELQTGAITGTLMVDGDVAATDSLYVTGTLSASTATVSGLVSAEAISVTDQATIGTLDADTLSVGGSVAVQQDIVVEGTTTLDVLAVTDLTAGDIEAQSVTAGTLAADDVFGTATTATTGQIQTLITGTCSGC